MLKGFLAVVFCGGLRKACLKDSFCLSELGGSGNVFVSLSLFVPDVGSDFCGQRHIVGDVQSDGSCHHSVVVFSFGGVGFAVLVSLVYCVFVNCFLFSLGVEVFLDDACEVVDDERLCL